MRRTVALDCGAYLIRATVFPLPARLRGNETTCCAILLQKKSVHTHMYIFFINLKNTFERSEKL